MCLVCCSLKMLSVFYTCHEKDRGEVCCKEELMVGALSLFLFAMDKLTDEARQECPWTMMFDDNIGICSVSKWRKI